MEEPTATVSRPFLKYAKSMATIQPAIALSLEFVLLIIDGNVIAAKTVYGT